MNKKVLSINKSMAYSSYGKKVYASIKDLPQYTSIGDGDKIIIWNETRDGAAVVDFADLIIDLEHTTFKSTMNEVIEMTSNIQSFIYTAEEEITNIKEIVEGLEDSVNSELRNRIKTLECICAIILGANSFWQNSEGIKKLISKFIQKGINKYYISDSDLTTDEDKEAEAWYNGYIQTVLYFINNYAAGGATENSILTQEKFKYMHPSADNTTEPTVSSISAYDMETVIKTVTDDNVSKTTISYMPKEEAAADSINDRMIKNENQMNELQAQLSLIQTQLSNLSN